MQNSIDRQRLMRRYGQDPTNPATLVAKCAAGILILIGIAVIGLQSADNGADMQAQADPVQQVDVSLQNAASGAGGAP